MNILKKLKAQQDRFVAMQSAFEESFKMAEPIVKEVLIEVLKRQPSLAEEHTFKLVVKQFSRENRQSIELYLYGLNKEQNQADPVKQ